MIHVEQAVLFCDISVNCRVRPNPANRFNWLNQYFTLHNTYCSYFRDIVFFADGRDHLIMAFIISVLLYDNDDNGYGKNMPQ